MCSFGELRDASPHRTNAEFWNIVLINLTISNFQWINFPPKIEKHVLSLFQKPSIKYVNGVYWCHCCDYLFEKKLPFIVKHHHFFVRGSISFCERIVFDVVQSLLAHLVINTTFHCNCQLKAYIQTKQVCLHGQNKKNIHQPTPMPTPIGKKKKMIGPWWMLRDIGWEPLMH